MTSYQYAEHIDGSIRPLERECECVVHEGPHWLYMDEMVKQMLNERMQLVAGDASMQSRLVLESLAAQQARRLTEKEAEMNQRGIVRLIRLDQVDAAYPV